MNEINIISSDKRYEALNEIFLENGYSSRLCLPDDVQSPNILILPIKSALDDEDFLKIFRSIKESTFVFCGQGAPLERFSKGNLISYSNNEGFLDKNAYITAECMLGILINKLEKSLSHSSIAIIGYGRIGKHLCRLLKFLGAKVTVFARREESRALAVQNGASALEICELPKASYDAILNTVPERIISKSESDKIPLSTQIYDLASLPGGFEDEERPIRALALPGKMMPISAGRAIFDFVIEYISNERS